MLRRQNSPVLMNTHMIKKIPKEIRDKLSKDPFMKTCCLRDKMFLCFGRVEWHHNLRYSGKRQNEWWSLLPLCHDHHAVADNKQVKEYLDWVMLNRAPDDDLNKYPKIDWIQRALYLSEKYGFK